MTALRFTRRAEADILAIHDYTVANFGARQWLSYEIRLQTAFENLQRNPLLGSDRSTLKNKVRRLIVESHVIYYRLETQEIVVLRLIGVHQDPARHL